MQSPENGTSDAEFALRHYAAALWRRKVLIVAVGSVGLLIGILLGRSGSVSFTSTVQILFQPRAAEQIFDPGQDSGSSAGGRTDPLSTEIAVMQSRSVRDRVQEEVGEPLQISISALPGTEVVALTAQARDRRRAELVAQTYAETFISMRLDQLVSDLLRAIETVQAEVAALDSQLAAFDAPLQEIDTTLRTAADENTRRTLENERADILAERQPLLTRKAAFDEEIDKLRLARNLTATGGAQIISDATPARSTERGNGRRNAAAGLALGLVFGVILAFVREHFDETVKDLAGFEAAAAPTPVLALLPRMRRRWPWWRSNARKGLVVRTAPRSAESDSFSGLWTALELVTDTSHPYGPRTLHIASPEAADGRTVVTANLALTIARAGHSVIVVDGNLRKPELHRYFGVDNDRGLTDVLMQETSPASSSLRPVAGEPGLRLLTAGSSRSGDAVVLSPKRVRRLLADLSSDAEVVLIDGPPLLEVADAVMFARAVDATLLLGRVRHTRVPKIVRAIDVLQQVGAPLVGSALNGAGRRETARRAYGGRWLGLIDRLAARRRDRSNGVPLSPVTRAVTSPTDSGEFETATPDSDVTVPSSPPHVSSRGADTPDRAENTQ